MAKQIQLIPITSFNIYGCELSTDIDIAIPINDSNLIQLYKQNKAIIDYDELEKQLISLGYDFTDKKIKDKTDINLLYFSSDGNLSMCLKGSKDTQNGIILTYDKHPQLYECFFTDSQIIETDIEDRLRGLSKYVLDNLAELFGKEKYKELRSTKAKIYLNIEQRNLYSIELLKQVNWKELFDSNNSTDTSNPINPTNPTNTNIIDSLSLIKSFVMKLCQFIMHYNDLFAYTKKEIAQITSSLIPISYDHLLYALTRKTLGNCIDLNIQQIFNILIQNYEEIVIEITNKYTWKEIKLELSNTETNYLSLNLTQLKILDEFIKSPNEPTDELINLLTEFNNINSINSANISNIDLSLNNLFQMKSFNTKFLAKDFLSNNVYETNQRSNEWLELLKSYNCGSGNNGQINFVDFKTNYNLIRGCLMEQLLITNIDWVFLTNELINSTNNSTNNLTNNTTDLVIPCLCGLLVEQKTNDIDLRKSINGIAPDLLLIKKNQLTNHEQLIPVEFKCLPTDPNIHNSKYFREIKLASKQIKNSLNIIKKNETYANTEFGVIIFGHLWNNQITVKYSIHKFNL